MESIWWWYIAAGWTGQWYATLGALKDIALHWRSVIDRKIVNRVKSKHFTSPIMNKSEGINWPFILRGDSLNCQYCSNQIFADLLLHKNAKCSIKHASVAPSLATGNVEINSKQYEITLCAIYFSIGDIQCDAMYNPVALWGNITLSKFFLVKILEKYDIPFLTRCSTFEFPNGISERTWTNIQLIQEENWWNFTDAIM